MSNQRTISAIAWDLDNTLIERDGAFLQFFRSWIARHAPGRTPAATAALIERLVDADQSGESNRLEFCRFMLEELGWPTSGAPDLWQEIQRVVPSLLQVEAKIHALLTGLAADFRMVVVTNGSGAFQRAKIEHSGLGQFFSEGSIFISGELGVAKPAAGIFEAVLTSIGLPPTSVLFVGDHPVNDVAGAAQMGMSTCWVARGRRRPCDLRADFVVQDISELPALLGRKLVAAA
jgi:putative hydrolase of the HAD superfamily